MKESRKVGKERKKTGQAEHPEGFDLTCSAILQQHCSSQQTSDSDILESSYYQICCQVKGVDKISQDFMLQPEEPNYKRLQWLIVEQGDLSLIQAPPNRW